LVIRNSIKCEVCGKVTLVRVQAGWLEEHPIRYYCANCGILITGSYKSSYSSTSVSFENGTRINETDNGYYNDYCIEVSGELLTEKIRLVQNQSDIMMLISPFIKNLDIIGREKYGHIIRKGNKFISLMKNDWSTIRRVIELYLNGKDEYLSSELHNLFPNNDFPENNKLELLNGIHRLFLMFYNPILGEDYSKTIIDELSNEIKELHKKDVEGFKKLLYYYNDENMLLSYEKKIYDLLNEFNKIYKFILPMINFSYSDKYTIDDVKEYFAITTCSFQDIKQFYIDSYETLTDMLILVSAYNNLKYRGAFDKFENKNGTPITIEKFLRLTKSDVISACKDNEVFNNLHEGIFDSELRNTIGHNSYEYNGITQEIIIINSKKEIIKKIYLIEFVNLCYKMFLVTVKFQQLVYITKENYYKFEGFKEVNKKEFANSPSRKIGRNDPCYCGSGYKYKKCCGQIKN